MLQLNVGIRTANFCSMRGEYLSITFIFKICNKKVGFEWKKQSNICMHEFTQQQIMHLKGYIFLYLHPLLLKYRLQK